MAPLTQRLRRRSSFVRVAPIAILLAGGYARAMDTPVTLIADIEQNGISALVDRARSFIVDKGKEMLPSRLVTGGEKLHSAVSYLAPTLEEGVAVVKQTFDVITVRGELDSETAIRMQSRYSEDTTNRTVVLFKENAPSVVVDAMEAPNNGVREFIWLAGKGWQFADYASARIAAAKGVVQEMKAWIQEGISTLAQPLATSMAANSEASDTSATPFTAQAVVPAGQNPSPANAAAPPERRSPFNLQDQGEPVGTRLADAHQASASVERANPFNLQAPMVEPVKKLTAAEKKQLLAGIQSDLKKIGISAKILDDDVTPLDYRVQMVQVLADLEAWAVKEAAEKEKRRLRLIQMRLEEQAQKEEDARIARAEAEYQREHREAERAARHAKLDRDRELREKRRERKCKRDGICYQSPSEFRAQVREFEDGNRAMERAARAQAAQYYQQLAITTNNYLPPPNAYPSGMATSPSGLPIATHYPSAGVPSSTQMTPSTLSAGAYSPVASGSSGYSPASSPNLPSVYSPAPQMSPSSSYAPPTPSYSTPGSPVSVGNPSTGQPWYSSNYAPSNYTTQSPSYRASRCTPPTYPNDDRDFDAMNTFRRATAHFEDCLRHQKEVAKPYRSTQSTSDYVWEILNPRPTTTTPSSSKRSTRSADDQKTPGQSK